MSHIDSLLQGCYPAVAVSEVRGRAEIVAVYDNIDTEYQALREQAAIIDGTGFAVLAVSGADATEFLDSLATKEIRYQTSGTVTECAFLDDDAKLLGLVFIERMDDYWIVLAPPESEMVIRDWVTDRAMEREQVQVKDMLEHYGLFFLEGPQSWRLMRDVLGLEVESLLLRGLQEVTFEGVEMIITRIGRSGEYGYAILAPREDTAAMATRLHRNEVGVNVHFGGSHALDICMLEIREPNLTYETALRGDIFDLGQNWFVQYDKPAYVGREALMAKFHGERRQGTVGFAMTETGVDIDGAAVKLGEEVIGQVLYARVSPRAGGTIGLAILDRQWAVSGITLSIVVGDNDTPRAIRTISAPMVRPISWDQKMV